ncbi:MAG: ATP synthase F1 subunit delta [Holosporales bacterium]|nr:ATP synthase F1 subunit delta [Holosporales bacterium]
MIGFIQLDTDSLRVLFTSLPGRYACSLFNEGLRSSCLDVISANFSSLFEVFASTPSIKKFLTNCYVNKVELHNAWQLVGECLSFCPIFSSLIWQIIVNGRPKIMKKVSDIYNLALLKYKGMREVTVTSGVPLLSQQKKRLEKLVSQVFSEKNEIRYEVTQQILGGVKISSEGLIIDTSTLMQFNQYVSFCRNLGD